MNSDHFESPIKTPNLVLEPIIPEHAQKLFRMLQSLELYEFIPNTPPKNVPDLYTKYNRWSKRKSTDGKEIWLNYAIYMLNTKQYVGTLQATIVTNDITYIAYEVVPSLWRKGVGKEACAGMIKFIYEHYPNSNIGALVDTRNVRSWKLLESLAFKRIEKIENADFFKGSTSDEYLYLLNRNDFNLLHHSNTR